MPPAIETGQLTKDCAAGFRRTRPVRALDGVTLSIQPGEVFGFLGPNGAGKTTTPSRRAGVRPRPAGTKCGR